MSSWLFTTHEKERSGLHKIDKNIRYSEAIIQLDEVQNKINITIWSTTSPRKSNLKDNINNYKQTASDVNIDYYTNIVKYKVAFYNQPLAMLRSMGVLEAIAKKLCRIEQTTFMKEKMKDMLGSAFAVDKSGNARGNDNADYQLPEEKAISYATYKSFKWYFKDDDKPENEKDYNQLLLSDKN